jgi:hypothetical protein
MRVGGVLFLGLILLMANCTYDTIDKGETTECPIDNNIKSKETAYTLIIGKWNWIKTTYTTRGAGITTETPLSTQKTLTFEFTGEKVRILENSTLTEEKYEIEFWGEGTNTVDDILVVRFFKLTGEFQGTSMLQLNTSGTCLTLVNSYNDAGGDLNFKRVD